ncbi:MAG: DHH family phosphoesterase [Candidatus Peribacteria bacterium]|nr:DHH family phosphoesterase [Candidatus Peribacteria bacterium]
MVTETIRKQLENSQHIAFFGHQNIDGDALGSMYGLGLQLEKLGKTVSYFTPDEPSPLFTFLDIEKLQHTFGYESYDVLVFLDFTEYSRISKFTQGKEAYFDQQKKIIIDHHLFDQELPNATTYRDDTAIATCELVYELTTQRWETSQLFDQRIATFLYMGMISDSGNFRHDEKHQTLRLMEDALGAIKHGADKQAVINNLFRNKSYEDLQFMQKILGRMQREGDIFYSRYGQAELAEYGLHRDSADYALYLMVDVKEAELILLGKETEEGIRFSLRGKGKYNCRLLAGKFGGGGHFNASGCTIPFSGDLESDVKKFVAEIKNSDLLKVSK